MPSSLITATGAGNWSFPADCPAGTLVTREAWGAGSGANGRLSTNFGAAGAGGAYAKDVYTVTAADIAAGSMPYIVGAGSAGTSGADPTPGGNTTCGTYTNMLGNAAFIGAATGASASPGTGWAHNPVAGITATVNSFGTDSTPGVTIDYIEIAYTGTSAAAGDIGLIGPAYFIPAGTAHTMYLWVKLVAGSIPSGATSLNVNINEYTPWGYSTTSVNNPALTFLTAGTWHQYILAPLGQAATIYAVMHTFSVSVPISTALGAGFTLRYGGFQGNTGSSALAYQSTPGPYVQALGGSPPTGITGGTATWVNSVTGVGSASYNSGGGGAAYNASGSGGGGSGGKDGVGAAGTTAGVGGKGDGASGGAGGTQKATSPGNAGTANVEGGGGGGGLITVAGTGGAGGAPGGGSGGAEVATGTGGTGGRGQLRLTYTPFIYRPGAQYASVLAQ